MARGFSYYPIVSGLLWAALAASACTLDGDLKHRFHLHSLICTDGWPIRILQDPRCGEGLCGYTCAPDRWHAELGKP